ncbi:alpha/beta fold hydrolase [Populibacterium corticicola]|uniref:Alpha/beta fold hydrolase n=1 Tax=Populibacterium corticicola TaxID=1812826 RepID=A0ABW5XFK6_9MICO
MSTQFIHVDGGRVAFESEGRGLPVVCLPGMGDLRSSYRYLTPLLRAADYQVICCDLRGHGDSDAQFAEYGDEPTASDLIALLETLETPAVVIGNSMSAGASVIAAARRPELFQALVLIGPFVRNPNDIGFIKQTLFRVALARPWARVVWNAYLPSLYAGEKPKDFAEHKKKISASMKRPGYTRSFSLTTRTNHDLAEQLLPEIKLPTLIVMGEQDPDFPTPEHEAQWIADTLGGRVAMIADAGHNPQSQQPDATAHAILDFLKEEPARA